MLKLKRYIIYFIYKITNYQLDRLLNYRLEREKFYSKKGYRLNLDKPVSFCEKVVWKKLHDRNPLLARTADKFEVRQYVKEVIGLEKADEILIPLYAVTISIDDINFDSLPPSYVVKSSHASGQIIIVKNGRPEKNEIIASCRRWLKKPFGYDKNEWAYRGIKRKIIIEKLLEDELGEIPKDYKFLMFNSKCRLIQVVSDRFSSPGSANSLFSPEWEYLNVLYKRRQGPPFKKPDNLNEMISLAEELSKPFDFVRVDLFSVGDKTYFGELTHYPGSGRNRIEPIDFDFKLGKYWALKPDYWVKNN